VADTTARYDDNIERTDDNETGSASVGPGLGVRVYWPVSPYLQIRTGATARYWYSSDNDGQDGFEVTGLDGSASDATVSADIALHKHLSLRLSDSYSRSSDSLTLASRGLNRAAAVSNNETALQADVSWTKRITMLTRVAHVFRWADDSTYDYLDLTREGADSAVLWRLNKQFQVGPYVSWQGTTYTEDKHNDSREVGGGLGLVYDGGYAFSASARVGVTDLAFSDSNVPDATSDYTGPTFGVTGRFATSAGVSHTVSVDYAANQGDLVGAVNYAKDLTTRYQISLRLRPRLTVSGTVAWVDSRLSDGGETANLYQGGVGVSYELTKHLSPILSYQRTRKTSDDSSLEYVDNLVALSLSYEF
jgi:hypothetical protein